eukprot:1180915-Prorocentrum_minimum.AAC.2
MRPAHFTQVKGGSICHAVRRCAVWRGRATINEFTDMLTGKVYNLGGGLVEFAVAPLGLVGWIVWLYRLPVAVWFILPFSCAC